MKLYIQLEDGKIFEGKSFGSTSRIVGGSFAVHRGMVGYEEVITDPTYRGKLMVMSYPMMGSYGTNFVDLESNQPSIQAFICRKAMGEVTNFRSEMNLDRFLTYYGIVGIEEVDVRGLGKYIQKNPGIRGVITSKLLTDSQMNRYLVPALEEEIVEEITVGQAGKQKIGIWDFGLKNSTLKKWRELGYEVTIFPPATSYDRMLEEGIDLLFFPSGPGRATEYTSVIQDIRELRGEVPIFGMGLGAQLMALAVGGSISRLYGAYHSFNYPIRRLEDARILMGSFNNDYGISELPENLTITHEGVQGGEVLGFVQEGDFFYGTLFDPFENEELLNDVLSFFQETKKE